MSGKPCPECGAGWKQLTPGHARLTHRKDCSRTFANRANAPARTKNTPDSEKESGHGRASD
jgi:hypothetical protein